jgi:hypothetical protein
MIVRVEIFRVPLSPELAETVARLLAGLPSWFGIPESNAEYVASAACLPGLVAEQDGERIGVLTAPPE